MLYLKKAPISTKTSSSVTSMVDLRLSSKSKVSIKSYVGKGRKLEIHNNPLQRSTLGLSLVAGLVGDPKETDDFTLNLVILSLSHVKVEVDLTKPLPSVVEFQRQSGEVVEVQVSYPWLPPTFSHCKELGHVIRNCLHYIPPPPAVASTPAEKTQKSKQSATPNPNQKKHPPGTPKNKHYVAVRKILPPVVTPPILPLSTLPGVPIHVNSPAASVSLPTSPLASQTPLTVFSSKLNTDRLTHQSPSDKLNKPSLKRTRSSPTLSPPSHPSIHFQSSTPFKLTPQPPLFPEIGTLQYIQQSPFIGPTTSNPFSPLILDDSLQSSGDPPSNPQ
ncbi:mucin-2-like [Raphanus sativus]|nr:mucin-2-like [Raphanus sativus]